MTYAKKSDDDFWLSEVQRLIDTVGSGFLRVATFEEVLASTGPSYLSELLVRVPAMDAPSGDEQKRAIEQMRSVWEVAVQETRRRPGRGQAESMK